MYFQVVNTPENVRRKRQTTKCDEYEDNPRLTLAPFSAAPVVTFENVSIGVEATRTLELYNPTSCALQLSISKYPPAELGLLLSWEELTLEAHTVASLVLAWKPAGPAAQRFNLQVADHRKGRYDASVICKTQPVTLKKTAGKKKAPLAISKPTVFKRSLKQVTPKRLSPKRLSPKTKAAPFTELRRYANSANIEAKLIHDSSVTYTKTSQRVPCLPAWVSDVQEENRRDTYLLPGHGHRDKENQHTPPSSKAFIQSSPGSVLSAIENLEFTPSKVCEKVFSKRLISQRNRENIQNNIASDKSDYTFCKNMDSLIENLEFTPLKNESRTKHNRKDVFTTHETVETCTEEVKQYVTVNNYYQYKQNFLSEVDQFDFSKPSADVYQNAKNRKVWKKDDMTSPVININVTHPIIDLRDTSAMSRAEGSSQLIPPSIHFNGMERTFNYSDFNVSPMHFNDSSKLAAKPEYALFTPNNKNFNDSVSEFAPQRCSTERKETGQLYPACKDKLGIYSPAENVHLNTTYGKLSSETYTKGDSPIVPIDPANRECLQSSPYSVELSPLEKVVKYIPVNCPRKLPFSENSKNFNERADVRNAVREKNSMAGIKEILEADLWQKSPPKSTSPTPLAPIPEESVILEQSVIGASQKKYFETFILDKTFDNTKPVIRPISTDKSWRKTCIKLEPVVRKQDVQSQRTTFTEKMVEKHSVSNVIEIDESCMTETSHCTVTDETFGYVNIRNVATTMDPFMASTCLYDKKAYDEMEREFVMWLNYLLTPPADLDTNLDNTKIDIGKAWLENKNKQVPAAPTNEQVSSKYHTSHRLESLRKTARTFISGASMTEIFIKVTNQVERKYLSIQKEKNLHLDIGLQKIILSLLLCYNPLWLRIGLETVYNKKIPLTSNNDIMGLSGFIIERMFKDPYTASKQPGGALPNMLLPSYMEAIKKFTLKKFLFLVYFLDQAKSNKIILHDPCLFCRNAPFKKSREILIQFTKELLSGVGDITKHLRPTGYIVTHEQTYLHEFKYAVHNLAVDLTDGVRLTRLMEIILLKEDLISNLRVPAVSRLRKIHNCKVALTALQSTGFEILGDITSKDIADGHREKTLSLLWQLINKFRAPLFVNAAFVIQKWWRRKYLRVWINNRIEKRREERLSRSATVIQSWWRKITCRRTYLTRLHKETTACVVLQKYCRTWLIRRSFQSHKKATALIQRWYRNALAVRESKKILTEMRRHHAAKIIQTWYRRIKEQKAFELHNVDREVFLKARETKYLKKCAAAVHIQRVFRANKEMQRCQGDYNRKRLAAITLQRWYRSVLTMRTARHYYQSLKEHTHRIQALFRAKLAGKTCSHDYMKLKNACITVQNLYRAKVMMKRQQHEYQQMKSAAIDIQRRFRAYACMKQERMRYLRLKEATVVIQRIYRNRQLMMKARSEYVRLHRAAVFVQRRFRAKRAMREAVCSYNRIRNSVIIIQNHYRARLSTKAVRAEYLKKIHAILIMQTYCRAYLSMKLARGEYLKKKHAVLIIQRYYRTYSSMKMVYEEYLKKKHAILIIQRYFREYLSVKMVREEYLKKKHAILTIQRYYRAYLNMKMVQEEYLKKKSAVIILQKYFRAYFSMKVVHEEYLKKKHAVITIQKYYRAYVSMKMMREEYLKKKDAIIILQQYYRAHLSMKVVREEYLKKKHAALILQKSYRTYLSMKVVREEYLKKKHAVITIQKYYRAYVSMKMMREEYLKKKDAVIILQQYYRAHLSMKVVREEYLKKKHAALILQKSYRTYLTMKVVREEYLKKKHAILIIQRYFRTYLSMKTVREEYLKKKQATLVIQRHHRANLSMKMMREEYLKKKHATLIIQRYYRAFREQIIQNNKYLDLKSACITVQRRFRARKLMIKARNDYNMRKRAAVTIQLYFRSFIAMRTSRCDYVRLCGSVVFIQRKFRANREMRRCVHTYESRRVAIVKIQQWYRSIVVMRAIKSEYVMLRKHVIVVQRFHRANTVRKSCQEHYQNLKKACIAVQNRHRANVLMRKESARYRVVLQSVLIIQRRYRACIQMRWERRHYIILRESVVRMQQIYRNTRVCKHARENYLSLRLAAVTIQRRYRAVVTTRRTLQEYSLQRRSCTLIQRFYRSYREMRAIRKEYLKKRHAAVVIQRSYRRYAAEKAIKEAETEEAKELRRRNSAAIVIQSHWRGCQVRSCSSGGRAAELRRRWREGGLDSQQPTLAQRSEDALSVLCHFRDVASVIRAFKTLEYVTNVYPMMYASSEAVVPLIQRMVLYLGASNRSVSTLETLQHGLGVLINLAKYPPTTPYLYSEDYMGTLLMLMMRWCDKDDLLPRQFCTLFWVLAKYPPIRKDMAAYLHSGEPYKILCRVRSQLVRKRRMDTKRRQPPPSHARDAPQLPTWQTDFGIPRSSRPALFLCSSHAIDTLFATFQLPVNHVPDH